MGLGFSLVGYAELWASLHAVLHHRDNHELLQCNNVHEIMSTSAPGRGTSLASFYCVYIPLPPIFIFMRTDCLMRQPQRVLFNVINPPYSPQSMATLQLIYCKCKWCKQLMRVYCSADCLLPGLFMAVLIASSMLPDWHKPAPLMLFVSGISWDMLLLPSVP